MSHVLKWIINAVGILCAAYCVYASIENGLTDGTVFVCISVIFLVVCRLSTVLPSGSAWRPGVPLAVVSIFLLPSFLVPLVVLPGILRMSIQSRTKLNSFIQTTAHLTLSFYPAAVVYQLLVKNSDAKSMLQLLPAGLIGLVIYLFLNRLMAAVFIASRENRSVDSQIQRTLRELHLAYPSAYVLSFMSAILCRDEGIVALLCGAVIHIGIYRALRFYSRTYEWQRKALTDGLTGVGNRLSWDVFSTTYQSQPKPGTLAVIDLDHFKSINDKHGHAVGDSILKDVGSTFASNLPTGVQAFRYGGDEFVVFYPHNEVDSAMVLTRLERLVQDINYHWSMKGLRVHASIGAAMYPIDGMDLKTLFEVADSRMYEVKESRRPRSMASASES